MSYFHVHYDLNKLICLEYYTFTCSTFTTKEMRIALIGYGKMGKIIESMATKEDHSISGIISTSTTEHEKGQILKNTDAAIEFSVPEKAFSNIQLCWQYEVPVVAGTTGWLEQLPQLTENRPSNCSLFYAANFSIGVNIFFALNKYLAKLMDEFGDFDLRMKEVHHVHKKDAPSGTALSLAHDILSQVKRKDKWVLAPGQVFANELSIESIREGEVFGYHELLYTSALDQIKISHDALGREGFALGAIKAAEWLIRQPAGIYSMSHMLKL